MSTRATLRPARPEEREAVEALLASNDFPTADLPDDPGWLRCLEADGERVAVGGLEPYGDHALLRSVVVEPSARGEGHGRALCEALIEEAEREGFREVHLLTTTAATFFGKRGFETAPRETAPAAIRETAEFTDLCPDAATYMRYDLDR